MCDVGSVRAIQAWTITSSAVLLLAAGCGHAPTEDRSGSAGSGTKSQTAAVVAAAPLFSDFPVPPKPAASGELLARGQRLYAANCAACHGDQGDGKGPAAAFLVPRPRNFVEAKYRLRSTEPGALPTDVDLFRAISLGLAGTAMPPWRFAVSPDDRWALVEYLKRFSPRFDSEPGERPLVDLGVAPPKDETAVAEGRALFTKMACNMCHGERGRGDGPAAVAMVDDSGLRIRPRDFSRPDTFKSGYAAREIVRTILTGFNGTPMAGFQGTLPAGDAWKIAYYVQSLARPGPSLTDRPSRNYLEREKLGEPDVRINLIERAWKYDPEVIRVERARSWRSRSSRPTTGWASATDSPSAATTRWLSSTARWSGFPRP